MFVYNQLIEIDYLVLEKVEASQYCTRRYETCEAKYQHHVVHSVSHILRDTLLGHVARETYVHPRACCIVGQTLALSLLGAIRCARICLVV